MGSGTTAIAALMSNRKYVGYEIEEKYIRLANDRIRAFKNKRKQKKITDIIRNPI